ncbi:hypothetical protein K502DRAFT_332833 [Neoconidiobolus thromboides FSU 785]|nr:hypothetical protein K502DRAFT_332833 [Neoconidiobolus thromboides FSU 785]
MKSNSRSNPDKLNSSTSEDDGVNAKSTKLTINEDTLSLLIRRITIYCVIPTVTQFGCTLAIFYGEVHGEIPFWMYYLDVVATHLSGILSLVGFLYDPALKNSLNFIKLDLLNYKVNSASYDNEFNFNPHHHPWICILFRKMLLGSLNDKSNGLNYSNNTPIQNIIVDVKEITDNEKFPNNDNNINMKDLSQRSQHTIDSYDTNNTGANLVKADSNDTNKNSKAKRKDKNYFRAVAGL